MDLYLYFFKYYCSFCTAYRWRHGHDACHCQSDVPHSQSAMLRTHPHCTPQSPAYIYIYIYTYIHIYVIYIHIYIIYIYMYIHRHTQTQTQTQPQTQPQTQTHIPISCGQLAVSRQSSNYCSCYHEIINNVLFID